MDELHSSQACFEEHISSMGTNTAPLTKGGNTSRGCFQYPSYFQVFLLDTDPNLSTGLRAIPLQWTPYNPPLKWLFFSGTQNSFTFHKTLRIKVSGKKNFAYSAHTVSQQYLATFSNWLKYREHCRNPQLILGIPSVQVHNLYFLCSVKSYVHN